MSEEVKLEVEETKVEAKPVSETESLVKELVDIIGKYGNTMRFSHTPGLLAAIDRPDLVGRSARITWGATMRNPESAANTPADVKARANEIMDRLDQIQKDAPEPPPAKKRD